MTPEMRMSLLQWVFRLIAVLLWSGLAAAILAALQKWALQRAASCALPRPVAPESVRTAEALAAGMLVTLICGAFWWQPWMTANLPEMHPMVRQCVLGLGGCVLATAAGVALLTWLRLPTAAVAVTVVAFCGLGTWWSAPYYEWTPVANAMRSTPVPVVIGQPAGLPPAAVTINGVDFGQTPVRTTWEELRSRLPEWKTDSKWYQDCDHGTRFHMHAYLHSAPDREFRDPQANRQEFFVQLRLGEQPLYAPGWNWEHRQRTCYTGASLTGGRVFGRIQPGEWRVPDLMLSEWGAEVVFLLHRARLMDYAVDDAWSAAFESYGGLGDHALMHLDDGDPGWDQVRLQLARRRYSLPEQPVAESQAWRQMLAIIDAAADRGEFRTLGPEGVAVTELARSLSTAKLAHETARVLQAPPISDGRGMTTRHTRPSGKTYLIFESTSTARRDVIRGQVLAQLAIARDAELDARASEPDNPIEAAVAPVLMRQQRYDDEILTAIGGRQYETMLLRQDWQSPPDVHNFQQSEYVWGVHINRWLRRLARLETPRGRQFRRREAQRVLDLAQQLWSQDHLPDPFRDLDFLLLDHRDDEPRLSDKERTLAEHFWPQFRERRSRHSDQRETLQRQWTYLARMSPDSRPEQFVSAYRDLDPEILPDPQSTFIGQMRPAAALEVVRALLDENQRMQLAITDAHSQRVFQLRDHRSRLLQGALLIDDPAAVDVLQAELQQSKPALDESGFANHLRFQPWPVRNVAAAAALPYATLRRQIAAACQFQTQPAYRRIVERLAQDADESVSTAARQVLDAWQEWRSRPLPVRQLPDPVAAANRS